MCLSFQLIPENNTPFATKSAQEINIPFFISLIQKLFLSFSDHGVE